MEVRLKGNYEQWIKFFLLAVYEYSEDAIKTVRALQALHDESFKKIDKTGISYNSVSNAIKKLVETFLNLQESS